MTEDLKMDPTIKAEWVAALRSGDYTQTTGVLKSAGGGYCCLGVLTDLALKAGVQMEVKEPVELPDDGEDSETWDDSLNYNEGYTFNGDYELTPEKVVEWAKLPDHDSDPTVAVDEARNGTLSNLNDSGKTFAEIADLIEKSL